MESLVAFGDIYEHFDIFNLAIIGVFGICQIFFVGQLIYL
jgi:hypothetical protein